MIGLIIIMMYNRERIINWWIKYRKTKIGGKENEIEIF